MPPQTNTVEIPCLLLDDCFEVLQQAGVRLVREDRWCRTEREHGERKLPLLQGAYLPDGWTVQRYGDNGMGKALCDDKGRWRAEIFCKHTPFNYSDRADMRAVGRFRVRCEAYGLEPRQVFTVRDGGEEGPVVFTSQEYAKHSREAHDAAGIGTDKRKRLVEEDEAASTRAGQECRDWLDRHYPDWRNKSAYWD